MVNEVLIKDGTEIVWANSGDFSVTGITRTDQIDLTGVLTAEAREGAKVNLGDTRADEFVFMAVIETATAPVSRLVVEFFWAASGSPTAATFNPGGTTGSDADYTGTAGDSLDDSLTQLDFIGSLPATSDATTEQQVTFLFRPKTQWGFPVVVNRAGVTLASDAIEMYLRMIPRITEIQ